MATSKSKAAAPRYPHPTKPGCFVSRQRIHQLRRVAAGLCGRCGKGRKVYRGGMCRACYAKWNAARELSQHADEVTTR